MTKGKPRGNPSKAALVLAEKLGPEGREIRASAGGRASLHKYGGGLYSALGKASAAKRWGTKN